MMLTALFLVWLQMSAQPVTRVTMYESMCRRPMVEYGGRYQVIAGAGECFIFERNIGEVYWSGPHGQAILFPIGSPLDDITRAEFAEAAQRAADETDGKPLHKWKAVSCDQPGMTCTTGFTLHPFIPPPRAKAEPVDVPAVQVDYVARPKGQFFSCGLNLCKAEEDIIEQRPGCADKSRILEHDENSPPKYWCRKVQP